MVQWPANAVHHLTGLVFGWINGPKLFDADGIVLGSAFGIQFKLVNQLFAQMTPAAFRENGVFA